MNRVLTSEMKQGLATSGAVMSQMPSGIPTQKYYTPDGREELKVPQHRTRQDGVVYDIFLADGYTLTPPEHPKPYCKGCDRWHDTQKEVDSCIAIKKKKDKYWQRKANMEVKKEQVGKDKEIAELRKQVEKLTKLMEAKLGKIL